MITPMTKYSFILLNGTQNELLEQLQGIGLVDITRSARPVDENSREIMSRIELLDGLVKGLKAADIPAETVPEHIDGDIVRLCGGMLMRYSEDREEIAKMEKELEVLRVWGNFDRDILRKLSDAGVPIHFHRLPPKQFNPSWEEEYVIRIVSEDKKNVFFVVAGDDALPGEIPVPEFDQEGKEKALEEKRAHFSKVLSRLAGAKERIPELERLRKESCASLDLYLANAAAVPAAEDTIVTLVGYAPTENDATVCEALDKSGFFYLKEAAVVEDNPPIKYRNNWFVRQFEVLTDMYGRPDYNEFDPTPYISVFFLLFFAMCMGDAGYGLLLIVLGFVLRKSKGLGELAPLVTILGAGTFVIGIVMHTFFGVDISALEWVPSWMKAVMITGTIAGFEAPMVLSLVIGVIHLCLAMVLKTVYATRNKGFLGSLGTWGWTLLIVGGVILGTLALFSLVPMGILKWIIIGLGIVSALGIFLFNDIKRNPLVNIGSGLWEAYNTVTGLLGDVLSYLRLYALGLAGGMLGKAFNDIASMTIGDGGFGIGWLFFILILAIGHALNLAMCCLGAFVHPLRLNFLEFFKNAGYDGKGRTYTPVKK